MRVFLGVAILILAIAVLTFGILAFVSIDHGPAPEEYAVWSALVEDLLAPHDSWPARASVLIQQTTEPVESQARVVPLQLLALGTEREIRDFRAKNRHPWLLQQRFNVRHQYALIDRSAVRQFIVCQYRRCPSALIGATAGAIISVSRVGFDLWRHHAVLEFSYVCGQGCGAGGYASMRKQDGHWVVDQFSRAWFSAPTVGDPATPLPSPPHRDVR